MDCIAEAVSVGFVIHLLIIIVIPILFIYIFSRNDSKGNFKLKIDWKNQLRIFLSAAMFSVPIGYVTQKLRGIESFLIAYSIVLLIVWTVMFTLLKIKEIRDK